MATLEIINFQPMVFEPGNANSKYNFNWTPTNSPKTPFPQVFFADGEPWYEVNRYAFYRYYEQKKDIKTVLREMSHLARYADWLEKIGLHWKHFPKKKSDRCLYIFRGYLLGLRDKGLMAPSTVSQCMNSAIAFYRWASAIKYIEEGSNLFDDKTKNITLFDRVGFSRTIRLVSNDLSIPNRARAGVRLENGLTPISSASIVILMNHLAKHQNYELYMMAKVALQTGCRHETVSTLNINSLRNAYPDHSIPHLMRVRVGPGTKVDTKFDVSGEVYIPKSLVTELMDYFNSPESIFRRSKAKKELQQHIFLTRQGNKYSTETFGTLLYRLKGELIEAGHTEFGRFKFHQLRATFGTMLMRALLNTKGMTSHNAIIFVQEAMLHKHASTTWRYIQFIEKEPVEEKFLDNLWAMFTGNKEISANIIENLTNGDVFNA